MQTLETIRERLAEMADASSAQANKEKSAYKKAKARGEAKGLNEAWVKVEGLLAELGPRSPRVF